MCHVLVSRYLEGMKETSAFRDIDKTLDDCSSSGEGKAQYYSSGLSDFTFYHESSILCDEKQQLHHLPGTSTQDSHFYGTWSPPFSN